MHVDFQWNAREKIIDEAIILCVHRILDIKFPSDFLEVIGQYPGASPIPLQWFDIKDKNEFALSHFLSFNPNSPIFILKHHYRVNFHADSRPESPGKFTPFAETLGDDLCYDYRDGYPPKIVLLCEDIEWYFSHKIEDEIDPDISLNKKVIFVADSLTEFIDMLYEIAEYS